MGSSLDTAAVVVLPHRRHLRRRARSDRSLVAGALAGDEADLEQLFRRHWPQAYRVALLPAIMPLPRTSRRRRSSPPCARSTASTGAARSRRGW